MKPLLPVAVAAVLAVGSIARLRSRARGEQPAPGAPDVRQEARRAAGPEGDQSPGRQVSSKVEINVAAPAELSRTSTNGTEITEYRDKGKPVEINVQSNFGTRYQMSAPADTSPTVRDNGKASTRLPSVNLSY